MCPRPALPDEEKRVPFRATATPRQQAWLESRVGAGKRWHNESALLADGVEVVRELFSRLGLPQRGGRVREALLLGLLEGLRQGNQLGSEQARVKFRATTTPEDRAWLDALVGAGKLWRNDSAFLADALELVRSLSERSEGVVAKVRQEFFSDLVEGLQRSQALLKR